MPDEEDPSSGHQDSIKLVTSLLSSPHDSDNPSTPYDSLAIDMNINGRVGSTGKGILIGMLSAFSSAGFVAVVFAVVYFFRYTRKGRIILDRIGRPGEFDDEQALAREEEQALEHMDDLQRAEYLRAKGASSLLDKGPSLRMVRVSC